MNVLKIRPQPFPPIMVSGCVAWKTFTLQQWQDIFVALSENKPLQHVIDDQYFAAIEEVERVTQ